MDKFYVVAGETGGAITLHYKNALSFLQYIDGEKCIREFADFKSAEGFLLGHLSGILPQGFSIPEHLELNRLVTICGILLEQMM